MSILGRLRRPADFEAVLATPVKARSAHFAAHHLARRPAPSRGGAKRPRKIELSTDDQEDCPQAVDDQFAPPPDNWWIGVLVPKRHARKATARNLLRRQIRGAIERHHACLAHGMWLVRLRAQFDPRRFRSAAPAQLRQAARDELDSLMKRAAR